MIQPGQILTVPLESLGPTPTPSPRAVVESGVATESDSGPRHEDALEPRAFLAAEYGSQVRTFLENSRGALPQVAAMLLAVPLVYHGIRLYRESLEEVKTLYTDKATGEVRLPSVDEQLQAWRRSRQAAAGQRAENFIARKLQEYRNKVESGEAPSTHLQLQGKAREQADALLNYYTGQDAAYSRRKREEGEGLDLAARLRLALESQPPGRDGAEAAVPRQSPAAALVPPSPTSPPPPAAAVQPPKPARQSPPPALAAPVIRPLVLPAGMETRGADPVAASSSSGIPQVEADAVIPFEDDFAAQSRRFREVEQRLRQQEQDKVVEEETRRGSQAEWIDTAAEEPPVGTSERKYRDITPRQDWGRGPGSLGIAVWADRGCRLRSVARCMRPARTSR